MGHRMEDGDINRYGDLSTVLRKTTNTDFPHQGPSLIKIRAQKGLLLTLLKLFAFHFYVIDHGDQAIDIVNVRLFRVDRIQYVDEQVQALFQIAYL